MRLTFYSAVCLLRLTRAALVSNGPDDPCKALCLLDPDCEEGDSYCQRELDEPTCYGFYWSDRYPVECRFEGFFPNNGEEFGRPVTCTAAAAKLGWPIEKQTTATRTVASGSGLGEEPTVGQSILVDQTQELEASGPLPRKASSEWIEMRGAKKSNTRSGSNSLRPTGGKRLEPGNSKLKTPKQSQFIQLPSLFDDGDEIIKMNQSITHQSVEQPVIKTKQRTKKKPRQANPATNLKKSRDQQPRTVESMTATPEIVPDQSNGNSKELENFKKRTEVKKKKSEDFRFFEPLKIGAPLIGRDEAMNLATILAAASGAHVKYSYFDNRSRDSIETLLRAATELKTEEHTILTLTLLNDMVSESIAAEPDVVAFCAANRHNLIKVMGPKYFDNPSWLDAAKVVDMRNSIDFLRDSIASQIDLICPDIAKAAVVNNLRSKIRRFWKTHQSVTIPDLVGFRIASEDELPQETLDSIVKSPLLLKQAIDVIFNSPLLLRNALDNIFNSASLLANLIGSSQEKEIYVVIVEPLNILIQLGPLVEQSLWPQVIKRGLFVLYEGSHRLNPAIVPKDAYFIGQLIATSMSINHPYKMPPIAEYMFTLLLKPEADPRTFPEFANFNGREEDIYFLTGSREAMKQLSEGFFSVFAPANQVKTALAFPAFLTGKLLAKYYRETCN